MIIDLLLRKPFAAEVTYWYDGMTEWKNGGILMTSIENGHSASRRQTPDGLPAVRKNAIHQIRAHELMNLKIKWDELIIEGMLAAVDRPIDRIDILLIGRETGTQRLFHASSALSRLEGTVHYYHYRVSIALDALAKALLIETAGDEDFDLYAEVYMNGLIGTALVRVSDSENKWIRLSYAEQSLEYGKSCYLFSFNVTEQHNGLILSATKYQKSIYDYYKKLRPLSRLIRQMNAKRQIWIIGERPKRARNNGWLLFQYMRLNHPEKEVYYVIDPESPDYEKAKSFGEDFLLLFKSKKYIRFLLMAQVLLTTDAPFHIYPARHPLWPDPIHAKKVLLQRSVLGLQDRAYLFGQQSPRLFKTDLLLVSSKIERRYAIETLLFKEHQLALTGLPRFDALFAAEKPLTGGKQLLFFPSDQRNGLYNEKERCHQTAMAYAHLIGQPEFNQWVKHYQFSVMIALPPSMTAYKKFFSQQNCTVIFQEDADDLKLIRESMVLVTDTDPIAFDFSFLAKPVLFYQPDTGISQTKNVGLRSTYLNELPGEIVSSESGFLYLLEQLAERGFRISDKNRKKAENLIEFQDTQACKRAVECVLDLVSHKSYSAADRS